MRVLGPTHHNWKSDRASYYAAHRRVRVRRGKPYPCEHCGRNDITYRHEWALKHVGNLYSVYDYIALCKLCHAAYDEVSRVRGSAVNTAKLTEEIVEACIRRYNRGERGIDLATEFGVSKSAMWKAIRGETWKHVHIKME